MSMTQSQMRKNDIACGQGVYGKTPKAAKPLFTVNVIEMSEGRILGVVSFPDSPAGNRAAEERFRAVCKENTSESTMTDEEKAIFIDHCIENGNAEIGTWELFLVHSKN